MIWAFIIGLMGNIRNWFPWKQKKTVRPSVHYHVENDFHFPGNEPTPGGHRNKAYADQRQKAPHNRRRKPSKAMRNLYKLENR